MFGSHITRVDGRKFLPFTVRVNEGLVAATLLGLRDVICGCPGSGVGFVPVPVPTPSRPGIEPVNLGPQPIKTDRQKEAKKRRRKTLRISIFLGNRPNHINRQAPIPYHERRKSYP
jgi:hypothetical protein